MSEPVKHYRYYLPSEKGEGYAVIFLDSVGVFSTVSDWGNYGYIWGSRGGVEFRQWLIENHKDWHYFAKKLDPNEITDWDATAKRIREHIDAYEKDGTYSDLFAAGERELLKRSAITDEWSFHFWYNETEISDAGELVVRRLSCQVEHFAKKTLPRLCAVLKAELKAEKNS
jgi:hypothetical protein